MKRGEGVKGRQGWKERGEREGDRIVYRGWREGRKGEIKGVRVDQRVGKGRRRQKGSGGRERKGRGRR